MSVMNNDVPFTLTNNDRLQPVWLKLKAYLTQELEAARKRNDNPQLSEQDTAAIRGDIKRLKALLALNEDDPALLQLADNTRRP